ncbi:alpha/beta hydrolase [Nautilia lithotrophica]
MKSLILILLSGILLYFGAVIYLYVTQENKIFNRKWAKPVEPKIAQKIFFKTTDGIVLEGAYTKNGNNLPLVLYFSGNANNVIEFLDTIAPKLKDYNFIGFNYPGYAGSEGKPCEKCILKYALEIFDRYKPEIIIGRSLGSAIAAFVASKRRIKKLILITPFDSIVSVAKSKYPFLPVEKLVKYKFKEIQWIKNVKAPVNVLLVENDDIIPQKNIDNLMKKIPNLNKKIIISGVKHGYIYEYGNIEKILNKLLKD